MQEIGPNNPAARGGGRRVLMAILGLLVLGSVGFAAAGGIGAVQSWLITVEVNGDQIDVQTTAEIEIYESDEEIAVWLDRTGIATDTDQPSLARITIAPDPDQDGAFTIQSEDGEPKTVHFTDVSEDGAATITIADIEEPATILRGSVGGEMTTVTVTVAKPEPEEADETEADE